MQLRVIQKRIYEIRGQKVMLDFDLAVLYKTETRLLKRAVRRNLDRFPEDFMFQLTKQECQELIPNWDNLPERFSPSPPFAFTEQGVAMLSSVLCDRWWYKDGDHPGQCRSDEWHHPLY